MDFFVNRHVATESVHLTYTSLADRKMLQKLCRGTRASVPGNLERVERKSHTAKGNCRRLAPVPGLRSGRSTLKPFGSIPVHILPCIATAATRPRLVRVK
jgi:hypothetical protein